MKVLQTMLFPPNIQTHNVCRTAGRGLKKEEKDVAASYLGDPGFKSRPEDQLYCLRFFSACPGKCWDPALKLGYDLFLPHPFQFTVQLSPLYLMICGLSH
jgi:hypothetical protein